MEFLIVDSTKKKKPIAVIGKIGTEIGYMTSNSFIKRVLNVMLKKETISFDKAVGRSIMLDDITKEDKKYLQGIGYMLEPPLRRHVVGNATVVDMKHGLEKLWKIYIGSTPPKEMVYV